MECTIFEFVSEISFFIFGHFPGNRLLLLSIFSNFVPLLVREHDLDLFLRNRETKIFGDIEFKKKILCL